MQQFKFWKKYKTSPIKNNLLISGSTRGSTTWLAEAINASHQFRIVFEPFTPWQVEQWRVTGEQKRYLSPDDVSDYLDLVNQVLLGNVHNDWTDQIKTSNLRASRVLVKCTRASVWLGWIQRNFPDLKIIIIVRDPYSVAFSNSSLGWTDASSKLYLEQDKVQDILTGKQIELLKSAQNLFQESIGMWAIETYLTLKHVTRNDRTTSVYYENLVNNPLGELTRLLNFYGLSFKKSRLDIATKRSSTTTVNSITSPDSQGFARRWEGKISSSDKKYADEVIKSFGLQKLYPKRNQPGFAQPLDLKLP